MIGTFYRKPSPESESYVEVGDTVTAETVVCIIEAMKAVSYTHLTLPTICSV